MLLTEKDKEIYRASTTAASQEKTQTKTRNQIQRLTFEDLQWSFGNILAQLTMHAHA